MENEIELGNIVLNSGTLTIIPACNPEAFQCGQRYIDEDLNRNWHYRTNPSSHEGNLVNYLRPIFQKATHHLDIHSHQCQGPAFAFIDKASSCEYDWAVAVGAQYAVYNFAEAFNNATSGNHKPYTLPAFARNEVGAKVLLIECGQNESQEADETAYATVIRTLKYFGLIDHQTPGDIQCHNKEIEIVKLTGGCLSRGKNDRLLLPYHNFTSIRAGQSIASLADGSIEVAPHDGYLFLPALNPDIGKPWFYYGKTESKQQYLGL